MADELDVLLEKVDDPGLRAELRTAVDKVRSKRTFGLVFESHLPERVRLPDYPVRRGTTVVLRADKHGEPMKVESVRRGEATVVTQDGTREVLPVDDVVVVAEFGEPVYPGLTSVGSIRRGGDKPAHVVLNAENHHALEMLQFTHAGRVDCIYIDPPYNTGAKDWKYDNNYVDGEDAYRHSKWLAFMERRLLLAKQLLNPDGSVLIVTIDEKEYLRLGLLLQQTFPGSLVQMISITINPKGAQRPREFARTNEFAFVCLIGDAGVPAVATGTEAEVRWPYLRRSERTSIRAARPNQYYPIFVDPDLHAIVDIGRPLAPDQQFDASLAPSGSVPVFPIADDGTEMMWGLTPSSLRSSIAAGFVRVTRSANEYQPFNFSYLTKPAQAKLDAGEYQIRGHREDGSPVVVAVGGALMRPTTVWQNPSHDAGAHGTSLVSNLLAGRRFPFPKSLYAVEDIIGLFVKDKPNAVIADFFAGSGTTGHAVMRLNRQDAGRRQAIVVTNNEVSADEATTLSKQGYRDGDPEWEALGIFEHITRPRITAAVTGLTPDGTPIKGDYKFTDEFPMAEGFEENVEFMRLTYLDPVDVELDRAFAAIAPMLWLRAGGQGAMVAARTNASGELRPFAVADRYGVLFDPDLWRDFVAALPEGALTVFVVTDSAAVFAGVAESFPSDLEVVRLYENYLTTFAINQGRSS
jgi:adenine-specific DNA-methyltransferase